MEIAVVGAELEGDGSTRSMDAQTASADDRIETRFPGAFAALSATAAAKALIASCDLALIVDRQGVIRDIAVGNESLHDLQTGDWLNQPLIDTIMPENRNKITEMLSGDSHAGRWRQVNLLAAGVEVPMRYLGISDDSDGGMVVVGRDLRPAAALQQRLLRAQQAMERDSLRLRQLEARYRLLFDSALEAIIVVDASTRQMTEANPSARRLAGLGHAINGEPFAMIIHADDREAVIALLGAVAAAKQRHPMRVRLVDGQTCRLTAVRYRQDRGANLLIRLQPIDPSATGGSDRPLREVLERMPDAFVLTDAAFAILASNGAFLDLVQQNSDDDVRSQPLSRFLGRPGIDIALMHAQLAEHGQVHSFATVVRAADGREQEVEVSAVTSVEGGETHHGFSLRTPGRRPVEAIGDRQAPRSVEQLTELVGRVSLKEIVRESTDLIERLCIEAALTYTSDNRASAAEILGLSRQSLYSKLHRHGLGNLSDPDT
jgi:transcriptional regulator PpsR